MGLTSISLGHAYGVVIDAVKSELEKGVNFQRPSYLELETAKAFVSLIPGHDMIKFAKNGSSATTAAVKLARAYTGRKLIAFPSDHPFYSYDDWFIGSTVCNRGVPEEISSLSKTFKSTNLKELENLFEQYPNQIACVITEPERAGEESREYLETIQKLCQKNGAVFILDEMITGFKTDFPGSGKKYNIVSDLSTWGKGIANGFSFCALTGKKEIMELGGIRNVGTEKVFLISSTHGGETHAMAACLATIQEFKAKDVVTHNHKIGKRLCEETKNVIKSFGLEDFVKLKESVWMPSFLFLNRNKEICSYMRTLFMQEMIKNGVLFQGVFIPCFSHTEADVNVFTTAFKTSLEVYAKALELGHEKFLVGEATKPVFRKIL
jgi:glutamate-1-semialdehyde aminotransferase